MKNPGIKSSGIIFCSKLTRSSNQPCADTLLYAMQSTVGTVVKSVGEEDEGEDDGGGSPVDLGRGEGRVLRRGEESSADELMPGEAQEKEISPRRTRS